MVTDDDVTDAIAANATAPAEVEQDGTKAKQHPLPDQIAAAKFLAAQRGASSSRSGIRFGRAIHPGAWE